MKAVDGDAVADGRETFVNPRVLVPEAYGIECFVVVWSLRVVVEDPAVDVAVVKERTR